MQNEEERPGRIGIHERMEATVRLKDDEDIATIEAEIFLKNIDNQAILSFSYFPVTFGFTHHRFGIRTYMFEAECNVEQYHVLRFASIASYRINLVDITRRERMAMKVGSINVERYRDLKAGEDTPEIFESGRTDVLLIKQHGWKDGHVGKLPPVPWLA